MIFCKFRIPFIFDRKCFWLIYLYEKNVIFIKEYLTQEKLIICLFSVNHQFTFWKSQNLKIQNSICVCYYELNLKDQYFSGSSFLTYRFFNEEFWSSDVVLTNVRARAFLIRNLCPLSMPNLEKTRKKDHFQAAPFWQTKCGAFFLKMISFNKQWT